MHPDLQKSVQYLKGVGPRRQALFERLGIRTVWDALNHFPRGYEDRSVITRVADAKVGDRVTLRVRVALAEQFRSRSGKAMARVLFEDDSGTIEAIWFNARYWREETFPTGREMLVTGKVDYYDAEQLVTPQCEPADGAGEAGFGDAILPEYPLTEALSQWSLRKTFRAMVQDYADLVEEFLPQSLLEANRLLGLPDAYRNIHFPESAEMAERARRRLVYDEFLLLQMGIALRRRGLRLDEQGIAFRVSDAIEERIRQLFPFPLTAAQERVLADIRQDMRSGKPMNRMLQGDVGSGKTVAALYALLAAVACGYQAAMMAPTEALAEQHYLNFRRYLAHGRVRIELMTGGRTAAERREAMERLARGEIDLAVGTHALVQPDVRFRSLGLVVVDEQHKFGVLQRAKLRQKGHSPDVLVMTATPIPRTLSLTVFGDLDVSVLDEMPPGRRPVKTRAGTDENRPQAYAFIRRRLDQGEQAFIVFPLVEESEKLDLQAATEAAERLRRGELKGYEVGLLHGRMSSAEKSQAMEAFREGRIQVLVSTVVIEVGIDVPNASVMLVEHAERFGLAQLHQLRGRVGRSEHTKQAWFICLADARSEEAKARLKVIASTADGFRIAEEDLRLRGPGEFFGTRQHGLPAIRIGDIIKEHDLLRLARRDAFSIVKDDPDLEHCPGLREKVMEKYQDRLDLIRVG